MQRILFLKEERKNNFTILNKHTQFTDYSTYNNHILSYFLLRSFLYLIVSHNFKQIFHKWHFTTTPQKTKIKPENKFKK